MSRSLISIQLKNGGSCFDRNGEIPFECKCAGSYVGRTCDEDICTGIKCINGGNCIADDTDSNNIQPKCDCPKDEFGNELFYGETCNFPVICPGNPCDHGCGNPCQNGGNCITPFNSNSSEDCIVIKM